jgi:hypothetical protein
MPDDHNQPEKAWDEYDWERFFQEQDRKTEKYMELLERYIDDPNRDQIIAREMGWNHLLDREGQEWAESVDSRFCEEAQEGEDDDPEGESVDETAAEALEGEAIEYHPLYQVAVALNTWISFLFEECGGGLENHPVAVKLSTHVQIATNKLGSALGDEDIDEIGMTIAYLKRALSAVTIALGSAVELQEERLISGEQFGVLNQRLFQIRDGVIQLMGEYRTEWRRRYGC